MFIRPSLETRMNRICDGWRAPQVTGFDSRREMDPISMLDPSLSAFKTALPGIALALLDSHKMRDVVQS